MIGGAVLLVLLSAVFFVLWQYFESPWLILGYIIAILAVCVVAFLISTDSSASSTEKVPITSPTNTSRLPSGG